MEQVEIIQQVCVVELYSLAQHNRMDLHPQRHPPPVHPHQGQLDYMHVKGGTGPLVYPAGHVWIYRALHWATGGGSIPHAQRLFIIIYLVTQALVLRLYIDAQVVPPWALVLLCLSKRIHSIYMLRLFNDGIAAMVAYAATLSLVHGKWRLAIVLYSAGVSIKMNVLLMAPPVLAVLLQGTSMLDTMAGVVAGVLLQLVVAAPFLQAAPWSYVSRAFEFSRVFLHTWSVNLKFLPPDVFQSKPLALGLLVAHVVLLGVLLTTKWFASGDRAVAAVQQWWTRAPSKTTTLSGKYVLYTVFTGNFVGIVCARTLHFQFYSWYFHTLPLLLWCWEGVPTLLRVGVWLVIEVVWNVFPSQPWSSLLLLVVHVVLLGGLLSSRAPAAHAGGKKRR